MHDYFKAPFEYILGIAPSNAYYCMNFFGFLALSSLSILYYELISLEDFQLLHKAL